MSLLEWLGESYNPGPSGSVELGGGKRPDRSRGAVLVRFVISVAVLAVVYVLILQRTGISIPLVLGLTGGYLLLGYFVHPKPDTSNAGWLGGLVDHPLRYSDDINRFLLSLLVFLLPGRFLAESLVEFCVLVRGPRQRPGG